MNRLRKTLDRYRGLAPPDLRSAAASALRDQPRCAASRYLFGCLEFDAGRPAHGVREWMIAYHAKPYFSSAALLVFSGLNYIAASSDSLLRALLESWVEYRRPKFDDSPQERALLDALAIDASPPPPRLSALGRQVWRLPIRRLRSEIQAAVALPAEPWGAALFVPV